MARSLPRQIPACWSSTSRPRFHRSAPGSKRGPLADGWTCQVLECAAHVAGLLLEIERAQGRAPLFARVRGDGAAPLIGSSPAIRRVRERIERVAATDFTVLIEGGSGPQPHR